MFVSCMVKSLKEMREFNDDAVLKLIVKVRTLEDRRYEIEDGSGQVVATWTQHPIVDDVVESVDERIRIETSEVDTACPLPPPNTHIPDNTYHRVHGKYVNHKLEISNIERVRNHNELTMHILECILAHCKTNK